MTAQEAQAAVKKYGTQVGAARALKCSRRAIQCALGRTDTALDTRTAGKTAALPEATLRGFVLGPEARITGKKPATTIRSRFYTLKRGMYYPEADAAREWVVSVETLRRHAQDADCFRYVETGNEKWVPCIMHPDTAKLYPSGK